MCLSIRSAFNNKKKCLKCPSLIKTKETAISKNARTKDEEICPSP